VEVNGGRGVKLASPPSLSGLSWQCESLDASQPYVPPRPRIWYPNSTLYCMLHMQPSQWQHKKFRLNVPILMLDWNSFGWNPSQAEWTRHQYILIDWLSVVTWLWPLTLDLTILFLKVYNTYLRFLHIHIAICVPSLVEISPGVPELCSNIQTHTRPFL
jgi:hypothetical protein